MSTQDKLAEALRKIAEFDCGCVPCVGECRKGTAAETELQARMEIAQEALAAYDAEAAQDAKDASNPLKGWIFDKVDMGRGDERYICTPDGANATTVRNESTTDHRERMLWLIADAMAKESGND